MLEFMYGQIVYKLVYTVSYQACVQAWVRCQLSHVSAPRKLSFKKYSELIFHFSKTGFQSIQFDVIQDVTKAMYIYHVIQIKA